MAGFKPEWSGAGSNCIANHWPGLNFAYVHQTVFCALCIQHTLLKIGFLPNWIAKWFGPPLIYQRGKNYFLFSIKKLRTIKPWALWNEFYLLLQGHHSLRANLRYNYSFTPVCSGPLITGVTRFGEIVQPWGEILKVFGHLMRVNLGLGKIFDLLWQLWRFWANFHCCKWN